MLMDFLAQGYPNQMWGGNGGGWGHMMNGYGGMYFPFGGLLMIVIIVGLGVGLYALIRRPGRDRSETAVEILKIRLAKGEISKEEYADILKTLK